MTRSSDEQQIREVIREWMEATAVGDIDRVLSLMADDVVFLTPGNPPMRGREAFAAASRAMAGKVRIEGRSDIQEIVVSGDYAYVCSTLQVTMTPHGGQPSRRSGPVLSVFRREREGRWVIFRDANMLTLEK